MGGNEDHRITHVRLFLMRCAITFGMQIINYFTLKVLTIKYIFPSFYSSFNFLKNAIGYYLSLAA